MGRVHLTFPALHPVTGSVNDGDGVGALAEHVGFEVRQRRWCLSRAQVRPHHPVALDARIGDSPYFLLEITFGWLIRHIDTVAGGVEFPTVVHTAQAALFVATEKQGRAAMRTIVLDQAECAGRDSKCDQLLAEEL